MPEPTDLLLRAPRPTPRDFLRQILFSIDALRYWLPEFTEAAAEWQRDPDDGEINSHLDLCAESFEKLAADLASRQEAVRTFMAMPDLDWALIELVNAVSDVAALDFCLRDENGQEYGFDPQSAAAGFEAAAATVK